MHSFPSRTRLVVYVYDYVNEYGNEYGNECVYENGNALAARASDVHLLHARFSSVAPPSGEDNR